MFIHLNIFNWNNSNSINKNEKRLAQKHLGIKSKNQFETSVCKRSGVKQGRIMPSKREIDVWYGARKLREQAQQYLRSLGYKILGGTKMLGELKIIDEFADKFDFRMFGPALLEKEVSWPVDYNGNPMLFFIGLPANLLNKKLDINLYCNIFITYDHEDDQHIYDLSDKNLEPNKSSCVILSDIRSSKVKKISCIEPSKKILISESDDEVPYWLQDPIQKSNISFQFQIYAGEIDNMFQQDFGDEFYYFFCNESCSEGNVFVQIT